MGDEGNLFVGGLSFNTDEDSLRNVFGQYGSVSSAKVITDRETGRSRGFGFVQFDSPAEADAAKNALDGQDIDGRTVRVNHAESRQGGSGGRGGGGGGYGGGGYSQGGY